MNEIVMLLALCLPGPAGIETPEGASAPRTPVGAMLRMTEIAPDAAEASETLPRSLAEPVAVPAFEGFAILRPFSRPVPGMPDDVPSYAGMIFGDRETVLFDRVEEPVKGRIWMDNGSGSGLLETSGRLRNDGTDYLNVTVGINIAVR